jgi:hypothetical protein
MTTQLRRRWVPPRPPPRTLVESATLVYRKTRTGSEKAASRRPGRASQAGKMHAGAGCVHWFHPPFAPSASAARATMRCRSRCLGRPPTLRRSRGGRARRPLTTTGKSSILRRTRCSQPPGAGKSRSALRPEATGRGAGYARRATTVLSRQPSHHQGERMSRPPGRGGQYLLPTPGQ